MLAISAAAALLAGCAALPFGGGGEENAGAQAPPGRDGQRQAAFEKVGEPHRPRGNPAGDPDNLSTDIERLQNARRVYEAEQATRRAELRRRQAECRRSGGSEQVPIEDGGAEPDTYCQERAPEDPED